MALGPVGLGVGLAAKAAINLSTANDIYKISKRYYQRENDKEKQWLKKKSTLKKKQKVKWKH